MRRWFKVLQAGATSDTLAYYAAPPRIEWDQCFAVAMPHQARLLDVLNGVVGQYHYLQYVLTDPNGDPARCYGTTNPGDDFHMHQPQGISVIVGYTNAFQAVLSSGFLDRSGQFHQPLLDFLSTPPLYPDGDESPN